MPSPPSLLDLDVPVIVEIARRRLSVREVLALAPGDLIELPRNVADPFDVFVSNKRVARGEAVRVGERFGVRITEVSPVRRPADPDDAQDDVVAL